jgi:hypothetical protein
MSMFEIHSPDRWQVYRRLQELGIDCRCASYQSLQVEINGAIAATQIWSVTRQFSAPRQELVDRLEACWRYLR